RQCAPAGHAVAAPARRVLRAALVLALAGCLGFGCRRRGRLFLSALLFVLAGVFGFGTWFGGGLRRWVRAGLFFVLVLLPGILGRRRRFSGGLFGVAVLLAGVLGLGHRFSRRLRGHLGRCRNGGGNGHIGAGLGCGNRAHQN